MPRATVTGIALLSLLAITGCAQQTYERDDRDGEDVSEVEEVEPAGDDVVYEFEPYSSLDAVVGWPESASTAFYFVSVPIETECHWLEAGSLVGPDIGPTIGEEDMAGLEGLACGITATPLLDRDDVIDEVAWRVDEGVGDLVAAYSATVFDEAELSCDPVEVPLRAPGLSVDYLDAWFVVRPAAFGCADTVAQINEAIGALQLTEVLRHTTTFDEYVARGF